MKSAASCDYVLLGYPSTSIKALLLEIVPFLQSEAVVFDICSIKTPPAILMEELLPDSCHIIATHPIFGPQS